MKSYSASRFAPDPTAILFLIAGTALVVWLWADSIAGAVSIMAVLVVPALVYFVSTSPIIAATALILSAAASHFILTLGSANIAPEHMAVILLCMGLPLWLGYTTIRPTWTSVDRLLVYYIAAIFFSSALFSVRPLQTLKWSVEQALAILPYFLLRVYVTNRSRFKQVFEIFLAIGVLQAAYAVICFFANRLFDTALGLEVGQYGEIPGTYGIQREANILGSYSASCLIALLMMYIKTGERKYLNRAPVVFAAALISLSRAAIGATGIVLAMLFIYAYWKKALTASMATQIALRLALTFLVLGPALLSLYTERFSTIEVANPVENVATDADTRVRVLTSALAFDDIAAHPLFGTGTASLQLNGDYSDIGYGDIGQGLWISTTEIRVLHDVGLVGLVIFGLFLYRLAVRSWKLAQEHFVPEIMALLFAGLIYCISFQTTEGTLMAFSWVHLGLIGCGLAIYQKKEAETAA